jgi:hypothetical protein
MKGETPIVFNLVMTGISLSLMVVVEVVVHLLMMLLTEEE